MDENEVVDVGVVLALEAWWSEVLLIRSQLDDPLDPMASQQLTAYDLEGAYRARDRLEGRMGELEECLGGRKSGATRGADELLKSFSDRYGPSWYVATGVTGEVGDGWWWEYIPSRGSIRLELDEMIEKSRQRGNFHPEM